MADYKSVDYILVREYYSRSKDGEEDTKKSAKRKQKVTNENTIVSTSETQKRNEKEKRPNRDVSINEVPGTKIERWKNFLLNPGTSSLAYKLAMILVIFSLSQKSICYEYKLCEDAMIFYTFCLFPVIILPDSINQDCDFLKKMLEKADGLEYVSQSAWSVIRDVSVEIYYNKNYRRKYVRCLGDHLKELEQGKPYRCVFPLPYLDLKNTTEIEEVKLNKIEHIAGDDESQPAYINKVIEELQKKINEFTCITQEIRENATSYLNRDLNKTDFNLLAIKYLIITDKSWLSIKDGIELNLQDNILKGIEEDSENFSREVIECVQKGLCQPENVENLIPKHRGRGRKHKEVKAIEQIIGKLPKDEKPKEYISKHPYLLFIICYLSKTYQEKRNQKESKKKNEK